jgi:hypothetical protein
MTIESLIELIPTLDCQENNLPVPDPTLDLICEYFTQQEKSIESWKQAYYKLKPKIDCNQCGNYIDETYMNVNCIGCTLNPFYMNCFIQKGNENGN